MVANTKKRAGGRSAASFMRKTVKQPRMLLLRLLREKRVRPICCTKMLLCLILTDKTRLNENQPHSRNISSIDGEQPLATDIA